jgi:arsenate reductase
MNVLFLCNDNASRGIMAEALLNHLDALETSHRFVAYSGGAAPTPDGLPHHLALETLAHAGVATTGLRSKDWTEFAAPDAPVMDLVITLCDHAAAEVCPVWPGHPAIAHWSYADPAAGDYPDAKRHEIFRHTLHEMGRRLELLLALPSDKLSSAATFR